MTLKRAYQLIAGDVVVIDAPHAGDVPIDLLEVSPGPMMVVLRWGPGHYDWAVVPRATPFEVLGHVAQAAEAYVV